MDPTRGLCALSANELERFHSLPAARKAAGKRAHLRCYSKLLSLQRWEQVASFLSLPPGPAVTDYRLFFEVTLGRRIADCVVVALQPFTHCYIVEFKTAMSNAANAQSVTRKAQRLEGTAQLCDCANFLRTSCPPSSPGSQGLEVSAALVFKNQRSLRTLQVEFPALSQKTLPTSTSGLLSLLSRWQDGALRARLDRSRPTAGRRGPGAHVGPKSAQRAARVPRGTRAGGAGGRKGQGGTVGQARPDAKK
ncbi:BXRF1 [macacine gammaherpesvirus 10]|uniref:BXRF1 n=1 Tax=macacine gammaherpesvirus 10 TaxID=2560569 RepID=A0A0S0DIJ1_9GAMA|nr:BXRF1 [macacine gammaherpesvirus 10]ALF03264.1 BXRF1 [macacine gammaherpesvirus 10]